LYGRLTGNVPGFDKMFFLLQVDHFSSEASLMIQATKRGLIIFVYEDGTVSSTELPFMMNGKKEAYANPEWEYLDAEGNTVYKQLLGFDPTLTFVGINYDTSFVNPLWRGVNSQPSSMEQIANYGVAGQASTGYSNSEKHETQ
jgi:hypothetical protein